MNARTQIPFPFLIAPVVTLMAGLIVGTSAGRALGPEAPQEKPRPVQSSPVEISVYSSRYHGRRTASGERYDHHQKGPVYTAAVQRRKGSTAPAIPFGSRLIVSHGGRSITVRITDTGSHRPKLAPTWLDLPPAAWNELYPGTHPGRRTARFQILQEAGR